MASTRPNPKIVMTPPAQAGAAPSPQSHPRRPPANRSVSLTHKNIAKRRTSSAKVPSESSSDSQQNVPSIATDGKTSDGSPSSLQPLARDSSGESSNADKWFDRSNNEVRDNSASFADNDPPFFMRNSSSSETPPEAQQKQMTNLLGRSEASHSLPLRTELLRLGTDGSSTEDFRSVIDDLTVENKKLKRRLKKYEKLHDRHLKDEKLFEVRIHGLPAHKKRELEETLRTFAASLGPNGFPVGSYEAIAPALAKNKTVPSQTSLQNTDSAYASMSASGQGSSAQSGNEVRHRHLASGAALEKQNIHTYLHHIPEGLLPHSNPVNMTERTKKKMVVRRLEQLYAGKGAAAGGHQHPLQQQEVSQMAARADRAADEAQGQQQRAEGNREARIMMRDRDDNPSTANDDDGGASNAAHAKSGKKRTQPQYSSDQDQYSDQRPTRPLDLDPQRAQVPSDNLKYMRHLGFSPPDPGSSEQPQEGHGWVYLNLLINMAQLHTINVTTDFVRKALCEHSSKFELSPDGRKVRWKGGPNATRTSSSEGNSSHSRPGINTPDDRSPRKRPKLSHQHSGYSGSSSGHQATTSSRLQNENNKLVYTPLFFHKDSTDEAEDSSDEEDDSSSSPYPAPAAGDSSGMTSSGIRTTSTKKHKKRDDGPIIFYNNARFCTDLSGDRKSNGNANAPPYTTVTADPVGKPQAPTDGVVFEKRGPLAEAWELPEPMDLSDNPIPASLELSFPPKSPMSSDGKAPRPAVEMEVTGIGGVWPADNFAISVESRHARVDHSNAPSVSHEKPPRSLPPKFARILDEGGIDRRTRAAVHKTVITTDRQDLPPSKLPSALSYMPFDSSNDEDSSDVDDDVSVSPESPGALPPAAAPQPVELHYHSSEEDYEDMDDDESEGSLDLLAAAREADPDAIRAKEREYDANMADRLAEEIPAGSSAATAGGGSGFASPESVAGMSREDYKKAVRDARASHQRVAQKGQATGDRKKAQVAEKSFSSDASELGDEDQDEVMSDAE